MATIHPARASGSPWNPAQLSEVKDYQILAVLLSTAERTQYRALNPHSNKEVLVTLFTAFRLPANIPLRDSANILRMRSSDLARLKHQNVLSVIDAGECGGMPFVVHDFVAGTPLSSILAKSGRLGLKQCLEYFVRIGCGLDAAHVRNIYHGALRNDSILIDSNGQAYLTDLGIEYILQPLMAMRVQDADPSPSAHLACQPPERLNGQRLDRKGDLYSLAAVMFEALTGHPVVDGESAQAVKENLLNGRLRTVTEFLPDLSSEINHTFAKALAVQAPRRFDSGQEFVIAVARQIGIDLRSLNCATPRPAKPDQTLPSSQVVRPKVAPRSAVGFTIVNAEPEHGHKEIKPGRPFSGVKEEWTANVPLIPRNPIYLWGGCLLLIIAGVCGWFLIKVGNTPSAPPVSEATLAEGSSVESTDLPDTEGLADPRTLPVPQGAPVEALQDRELLGLLWQNSASETMMIDGLREAKNRHLVELINASVQPLHHESATVRAEAAKVVGTLGDKRIVPFLLALLQDGDPLVRREGALAIGVLGDPKAIPFLSARYRLEQASEVRAALKSAIGKISGYALTEDEIAGIVK